MVKSFVIIAEHHLKKNIGGAEVQADLLAQYLSNHGIKVTYISSDLESDTDYKNYHLLCLPKKKRDIHLLLRKLDADVYYQRGRKKLTGVVAEFCKRNKKKFVFASSMDIDCYKFKQFMRGKNRIKVGHLIKNLKKHLKDILIDIYSLWGIHQADMVLSQTEFQKNTLKKYLGIESKLFYNAHPAPKNTIEKSYNTTPKVLWLANIKTWKQPEIYLNLVTELSGTNINFLMAGKINNSKYLKLINEAENANKLFLYLGAKSLQESNELIANSDIFINTSKNQEGFPNTFIQAWFRGVPVISLQFDPDDLIKKHKLGYVAGNYKNMIVLLKKLIDDKSKRKEIAKNAQSFAKDNFLIDTKINKFIDLISN